MAEAICIVGAGFHGNSCGVRKSFFLPPPLPLPPSLPLSLRLPDPPACTDTFQECGFFSFRVGNIQVCVRTHRLPVCCCCCWRLSRTMSLKKRLSFKRTWNFNTVSGRGSASSPFVLSAVFLVNLPTRTSFAPVRNSCLDRSRPLFVCGGVQSAWPILNILKVCVCVGLCLECFVFVESQ